MTMNSTMVCYGFCLSHLVLFFNLLATEIVFFLEILESFYDPFHLHTFLHLTVHLKQLKKCVCIKYRRFY